MTSTDGMELYERGGLQSHQTNGTPSQAQGNSETSISIPETNENGDECTSLMCKDKVKDCSMNRNSKRGNVVSLYSPTNTDHCDTSKSATDVHTEDENETAVVKMGAKRTRGSHRRCCRWTNRIWRLVITLLVILCVAKGVYEMCSTTVNNQTSVARAEINWDVIEQSRQRLNITWKNLTSDLVSLDKTGSIVYVKENGIYSLSLLLTFDRGNNKQEHEDETTRYTSSVCLENSRDGRKTSCLREELPPNTARTAHIPVYVLLFKGDFFWVSASGFDNVYRYGGGPYHSLTIARYPFLN